MGRETVAQKVGKRIVGFDIEPVAGSERRCNGGGPSARRPDCDLTVTPSILGTTELPHMWGRGVGVDVDRDIDGDSEGGVPETLIVIRA